MAIHFGVEVNKGDAGENYALDGGLFRNLLVGESVVDARVQGVTQAPDHPRREPFSIRDEWYYHMRYNEGMVGVTPILSAVPR